MKKLLVTLMLAATILTSHNAFADDDIRVYIDGKAVSFEQPPVIQDGYTLVPMRAMFEALGADIDWQGDTQTVTGTGEGVQVVITIGEPTMSRSSVDVSLDMPAKIINDYTMIPLRAVSECFGMDVQWDGENRVINLTDMHTIGKYDWNDNYYYIGELKDGKPIGYGELHNKNTDEIADIGLFDGQRLANGTRFYDNGSIYVGEFSDGVYNGQGVYYLADGSMFGGNWISGELTGAAKVYYASTGSTYEGNFKDGYQNGEGTCNYKNGDVYHGEWKDGHWDGLGVYKASDGRYMCGWFKEDKYHGPIDFYTANNDYLGRTVYYEDKTIDECYEEELKEVEKWRDGELAKIQDIYDEIDTLNKNPMSSEVAQSIMNSGKYASGNSTATASNGGNIDSFALGNAMRNQQALQAANEQRALQAANQQIYQLQASIPVLQQTIETGYKIKLGEARDKWQNIEQQLINDCPLSIITDRY